MHVEFERSRSHIAGVTPTTIARVFHAGRCALYVRRHRQTKRSAWRLHTGFLYLPSGTLDEARAVVNAALDAAAAIDWPD